MILKLSRNERRANKIARRLQQMDDHAKHVASHAKRMNQRISRTLKRDIYEDGAAD